MQQNWTVFVTRAMQQQRKTLTAYMVVWAHLLMTSSQVCSPADTRFVSVTALSKHLTTSRLESLRVVVAD